MGCRLQVFGRGRDHRRIVRAELAGDQLQPKVPLCADLAYALAEWPVGRDTATQGNGRPIPLVQRPFELRRELPDDGRLKARRKVGAPRAETPVSKLARRIYERRLEPGEAEVEAGVAGHRHRELECLRITPVCHSLDFWTPGVAQAEDSRSLVEGFAGSVVERLPEGFEPVVCRDAGKERVPAARDQAQEGRLERVGLEEV